MSNSQKNVYKGDTWRKIRMNKRLLGDLEENLACEYMKKNGYTILERNFRCKIGEIDIVALDGKYLVFVEVKYRSTNRYGEPVYAINKTKQNRIYRVAEFYILEKGLSAETPVRFDAVTIMGDHIQIIKNAFGAM